MSTNELKKRMFYFIVEILLFLLILILLIICGLVAAYVYGRKRCVSTPKGIDSTTFAVGENQDLLRKSVTDLALMIRSKKVSVVKVVETFIERAKLVNRNTNAIVADRFVDALREAEQCDLILNNATGTDYVFGPLFGVPCTIKECKFF